MSKRRFSDAFPTFASAFGAASSVYNAFKRPRTSGSFTLLNSNGGRMATRRRQRFRGRYGSRTVTRRRSFRRRFSTRRRFRRIWSFMRNKGLRNIETKYVQINFDSSDDVADESRITILSNEAALKPKILASAIPLGSSRSSRIGNKVFLKTLRLKFYLEAPDVWDGTGVKPFIPNENKIRIVIAREKEGLGENSAQIEPRLGHVFQNNLYADTLDPFTVSSDDSRQQFIAFTFKYYNSKFADNYTILWDKTFGVSNENGSDREYRIIKKNISIRQPCHWNDTGDRGDGHIWIWMFCDITAVPETNGKYIPRVFCSGRITYTDV